MIQTQTVCFDSKKANDEQWTMNNEQIIHNYEQKKKTKTKKSKSQINKRMFQERWAKMKRTWTGERQRGQWRSLRSHWSMQNRWKTCLHFGSIRQISPSTNSSKQIEQSAFFPTIPRSPYWNSLVEITAVAPPRSSPEDPTAAVAADLPPSISRLRFQYLCS